MQSIWLATILLLQLGGSRPIDRAVEQLKVCSTQAARETPGDWQLLELQFSQSIEIPPEVEKVQDPDTFCIHGCNQWRSGGLRISISYGHWSLSSFSPEHWSTACVRKNSRLRLVVMTDGDTGLIAWPISTPRPNVGYEAVINVGWSDEREKALALRVIHSIRRPK